MKYYWVVNNGILDEFDSFEAAWQKLEASEEVMQVGCLFVAKKDIQIISSEEYRLVNSK